MSRCSPDGSTSRVWRKVVGLRVGDVHHGGRRGGRPAAEMGHHGSAGETEARSSSHSGKVITGSVQGPDRGATSGTEGPETVEWSAELDSRGGGLRAPRPGPALAARFS